MKIKDIAAQITTSGNNITVFDVHPDLSTEEINLLVQAFASEHCKIKKLDFCYFISHSDNVNVIRELLSSLQNPDSLEELNLSCVCITSEEIIIIAPVFEKMVSLRSLDLGWNEIDNEGIKSFAPSLEKMTNLESLSLSYNNFDAKAIDFELLHSLKKLSKLVILNLEMLKSMTERSEALPFLPEELPNLIFLNGEKTKNYEVAKKLAEEINSSGKIKIFEESLKYSTAVKYFLREDFKREDLAFSVDYLLKLENFRKNQVEEIKKLVASEEYKLKPKELAEAKIDEIRKGELVLYQEFVSSLSEEISLSFIECEMGLLMQQKELPQVNLISIDDSEGFRDEENIQKSKAKIFGLGNQGLNPIQITEKALGKEKFESIINSQIHKQVLSLFKFLANNQGSTNLYAVFAELGIELDVPKIEDRAGDAPAPNHEAASSDNQDKNAYMRDPSEDSNQVDLTSLGENPAAEMQVD